jgi:hypothetical protein
MGKIGGANRNKRGQIGAHNGAKAGLDCRQNGGCLALELLSKRYQKDSEIVDNPRAGAYLSGCRARTSPAIGARHEVSNLRK